MWTALSQHIDSWAIITSINKQSGPLSFREVISLWCGNHEFRKFFTGEISRSPFSAFFWETPPITNQTLDRPFEYVLVEAPVLLEISPDSRPFNSHFVSARSADVVTFPNLGGDAILVVPVPQDRKECYSHLACFLRSAPEKQIDSFWYRVGLAMQSRISTSPTWLSTAGLGVSWLHLRLDSRPKYYRYLPYKTAPDS